MAKKDEKICKYCSQTFNITEEEFVKVSNRYAHKKCYDDFQSLLEGSIYSPGEDKPHKKTASEKICFYCKKSVDIQKEEYRMARSSRYAHLECYNKNHTEDDTYADMMYEYLTKDLKYKYDYRMVESQRAKLVADGISNKDIFLALKYFYGVKHGDTSKGRGGIGIVPYVLKDSKEYWENYARRQRAMERVIEQEMNKEPEKIMIAPVTQQRKPKRELMLEEEDI